MDDFLYSLSNHVALKEELQQYFDIFMLLPTHYEKRSELLSVSNQRDGVVQSDDFTQDLNSRSIARWEKLLINHHPQAHPIEELELRS